MGSGICVSNCDCHLRRKLCCFFRLYWTLQSGNFSFLNYLNDDHYLLTNPTPTVSLCCYVKNNILYFFKTWFYCMSKYGLAKFVLIWALITFCTLQRGIKHSKILLGNWILQNHLFFLHQAILLNASLLGRDPFDIRCLSSFVFLCAWFFSIFQLQIMNVVLFLSSQ